MKTDRFFITPSWPAWLRITDSSVSLELHVQPGARRSQLVGEHGGRLKVAVDAPPLDGRANEAVVALIAKHLGVRPSTLRVVAGHRSRNKRVALAPSVLAPHEIVERLRPK